jgi:hypothetical protein
MPIEVVTNQVNGGEGRMRNVAGTSLVATAAGVTSNQAHPTFDVSKLRGRIVNIKAAISAVMTTGPSLTFRVQQSDDNVNFFDTVAVNGAALAAQIAVGNANGNYLVVGDYLQILVTVAGTGGSHSYTVTLGPAV